MTNQGKTLHGRGFFHLARNLAPKNTLGIVLSTCFGLIPFLAGGQNEVFWFALAAGTIGGLLFSALVLPVLMSRKHSNRFGRHIGIT